MQGSIDVGPSKVFGHCCLPSECSVYSPTAGVEEGFVGTGVAVIVDGGAGMAGCIAAVAVDVDGDWWHWAVDSGL